MKMINLTSKEYDNLKRKAELNEDILIKLVKGLEDIRLNRIKPWKKTISG